MNFLMVAVGGALGSVLRYAITLLFGRFAFSLYQLSLATLAVNVVGSFLIAIAFGLLGDQRIGQHQLYFLSVVGFCGGFTTFSTFSLELFTLPSTISKVIYVVTTVVLCFLAVWLGFRITK